MYCRCLNYNRKSQKKDKISYNSLQCYISLRLEKNTTPQTKTNAANMSFLYVCFVMLYNTVLWFAIMVVPIVLG